MRKSLLHYQKLPMALLKLMIVVTVLQYPNLNKKKLLMKNVKNTTPIIYRKQFCYDIFYNVTSSVFLVNMQLYFFFFFCLICNGAFHFVSFLFFWFKDVAWKIAEAAQQRRRGIVIMSANGMLKKVAVIDPAHDAGVIRQEVCHTHSISRYNIHIYI